MDTDKTLWPHITISDIRKIGTEGIMDEELFRKIRLINTLSLAIVSLIFFIGLLFYFLTWKLSILLPATIEFGLAISPIFLNHYKIYIAAALITYLTQCIASLYFGMLLGNVVELQTVIFFLLLITFLIFDKSRLRKVCFTVALIILVALEANSFVQFIDPLPLSRSYSIIFKTFSFFGLFFLIIIVGSPYVKSRDSSYKLKRSLKNEENQNNLKSVFIRNVSHEIQGTFLGIIKMAQSLRAGLAAKQDVTALSDQLIDACHTHKWMLTNLMGYTKIDAGVSDNAYYSPIDIRSLMKKIININVYSAIEKDVKIDLSISNEIPAIFRSDELLLTQVCNNLLNNAIKFTRPNSNIYIRIDSIDSFWKFSVKDEGDGIPEEQQKYIFDLYVTNRNIKNNREGVGLGLFITKHLVEDILNGSITVKSKIHSGACFEILLPFNNPN